MRIPKRQVIITMGDPAGSGPESVIYALSQLYRKNPPRDVSYVIIGSKKILQKVRGASNVLRQAQLVDLDNVDASSWRWGALSRETGRAAREYLDTALALLKRDQRSVLVTAPVSKEMISAAGVCFHGHTEYFAEQTRTKEYLMLFKGSRMVLSLMTRHIPLSSVSSAILRYPGIVKTACVLTYKACVDLLKKKDPRIGLCGVNPHAGIDTFLGKEEKLLLKVRNSLSCRKFIHGPYPADSLFMKAYQGGFDALICAYHDQAMIPLKMVDFDQGINITYGLPFLRVSPVYGTAADIAGTGKLNYSSMTAALRFANDYVSKRR